MDKPDGAGMNINSSTLVVGVAMLASAVLVLGLVGLVAWSQRGSDKELGEDGGFGTARNETFGPPRAALTRSSVAQLRSEVPQLTAHASAVARDAALADAAATAAWERCALAEQARDTAWQSYDAAQRSSEAAQREVEAGRGGDPITGEGIDAGEGERQVHRAALAAYRRGELSVDQLREVFRLAAARDPAQQEREHEAEVKGSEWRRARQAYEHAAAVERAVRQVAHVAEVAAQALAEEAAEAAAEAHEARSLVDRHASTGPQRRPPNAMRS